MIDVTLAAQDQVLAYFEGKESKSVRIFLNNGCGGAQLAMAVDEKTPKDKVFEYKGVEYVMDRELLDQAKPVRVDYSNNGFRLESSLKLSSGCSSCGTKGSCCS
jgi:Fe-S cluster assembly iron-binding protein IscA